MFLRKTLLQKRKASQLERRFLMAALLILVMLCPRPSQAQFVIADVLKLVVKKVINGIDITVQKVQNKTIVLQNAEKELENTMTSLQLEGIADWVEKQRKLYADYYKELGEVKQVISGYSRIRDIVQLQTRIVQEVGSARGLFQKDPHFSVDEFDHIEKVYGGIVSQSFANLRETLLIVSSLTFQMDDAARLELIDQKHKAIQQNYNDLNRFNQANLQLSFARVRDANDLNTIKALYGLQ